jgi:hypothetical protein
MAIYFIDFEAFQYGRGGEYKIKELCILDAGRPYNYLYYLFRQDMTWSAISPEEQRNYNYQTRCIHRLHWEEGHSVFCRECIMRHIMARFELEESRFYVMDSPKGAKIGYLRAQFPQLNFVAYGGVKFATLPKTSVQCPYRIHGEHCAYLKCCRLYEHYTNPVN